MSRSNRSGPRAEVDIEKLVAGGTGLARIDGEVVLVPRVLPNERVAIEIDRATKPARSRLLKVLQPSSDRIEPPCSLADRCGGCDWMHMSEAAQRHARVSLLSDALAQLPHPDVQFHAATTPRGRTRARWKILRIRDRAVIGYRAAGSNKVVEPVTCWALDPRLDGALPLARQMLAEAQGDGEVDAALGDGGLPVLSIELSGTLPGATFAMAERMVAERKLAGVRILIEGSRTAAVIGDATPRVPLGGGPALLTPAGGFAQASETGDAVLVDLVMARAAPEGASVLELFAGSGNFTVHLATKAERVVAVEVVEEACEAARKNLAARGLATRAKIVAADADSYPVSRDVDLVVLDPPRAGARGATRAIAGSRAKRVVYVSCDPTTLARDLRELTAAGFAIDALDAVDLFPHTSHVETIATLSRATSRP